MVTTRSIQSFETGRTPDNASGAEVLLRLYEDKVRNRVQDKDEDAVGFQDEDEDASEEEEYLPVDDERSVDDEVGGEEVDEESTLNDVEN